MKNNSELYLNYDIYCFDIIATKTNNIFQCSNLKNNSNKKW